MLDPHRARTFVGRIVFTSLCDKLVDITPDLKFTPELATEWSWSDDGKSLTFKLRPGVKFHDGEPMNAAAVKANIERARTLPDSLRKSELTSVDNVEAVDDLTVKVNLSRPDATLLSQLSDRAGMIMSPKALASADFAQKPVCSGPYKFVERVQNDRIVLEKFKDHWDAKNFTFDRIVFTAHPGHDRAPRQPALRQSRHPRASGAERRSPPPRATRTSSSRPSPASATRA